MGINISERDCFEISTCREREEQRERERESEREH